jgi:hypothetical protein
LPGRQLANTTSAMQIQPRPLTMLKKKALNADIVRKAPPTAISADPAATAPSRTAITSIPCASAASGFSPHMRSASPSGVR